MSPEDVQRKKLEGLVHLRFVAQLYKDQIKANRCFLHEHPLSAMSWSEDCMREIAAMDGVGAAICDQCMYGRAAINDGVSLPARRGTTFMTNCHGVAEQLRKRCKPGLHTHAKLDNWVAASTKAYPDSLVRVF